MTGKVAILENKKRRVGHLASPRQLNNILQQVSSDSNPDGEAMDSLPQLTYVERAKKLREALSGNLLPIP